MVGFVWHVEHHTLLRPLWYSRLTIGDYIKKIKKQTPAWQLPTLLRLVRLVKGPLPEPLVDAAEVFKKIFRVWDEEGRQAVDKAWEKWGEARETYGSYWVGGQEGYTSDSEIYRKAQLDYRRLDRIWNRQLEAWSKALDVYRDALDDYHSEIEALHKKECPNCTWNGESVFSEAWEVAQGRVT